MSKPESTSSRAAAADFLRVLSIALVAWYHFWQQSWLNPNFSVFGLDIDMYPIIRVGYMFVYNMILISGFVLMLSRLSGRYKSARAFYKARAVRILPSYLFCLIVFLFVSNMKGGTYDWFGGREHMRQDILAHLTFTHNLFPQTYTNTGLNAALWTVAVEVQFYAVFPLLGRLFEKRPFKTYLGMVLISTLCKLYVHCCEMNSLMFINRLGTMLDVFANGMLAAVIYTRLKAKRGLGLPSLLLTLASGAGAYYFLRELSYVSGEEAQRIAQMWGASAFSIFGFVFLLCGSLTFRFVKTLFSNPLTRFLAGISYNFYIWHQPISVWLKKLHIPDYTEEYPNVAGNVKWQKSYMLLCTVCALIAAFRVTYLVEKPCARLLNKPFKELFSRKKEKKDAA